MRSLEIADKLSSQDKALLVFMWSFDGEFRPASEAQFSSVERFMKCKCVWGSGEPVGSHCEISDLGKEVARAVQEKHDVR